MTRPIKFRAWDKLRKRFLKPEEIKPSVLISYRHTDASPEVKLEHGQITIPLEVLEHNGIREGGDADIQMFTGLLDKNGVEIYEGDIVVYRADYEKTNNYTVTKPKPVIWHSTRNCNGFNLAVGARHEVIGNIYENPELIQNHA